MNMTQANLAFIGNDDLYPTDIIFSNNCKISLACTEEGSLYLHKVREMNMTQDNSVFIENDDIYPSAIFFSDKCRVRIACTEEGKMYIRVEESVGQISSVTFPTILCSSEPSIERTYD